MNVCHTWVFTINQNSKAFPCEKVSKSDAKSLLDDIKYNCIFCNNSNENSFVAISLFNSWYGYQIILSGKEISIQIRSYWGNQGFSEWSALPI